MAFGVQTSAKSKPQENACPMPSSSPLAQDRHGAMMMGEAGADLILFGGFDPLALGDLDLATWWAELFEVPCACLIASDAPTDLFGQPGHPEFYLKFSSDS